MENFENNFNVKWAWHDREDLHVCQIYDGLSENNLGIHLDGRLSDNFLDFKIFFCLVEFLII